MLRRVALVLTFLALGAPGLAGASLPETGPAVDAPVPLMKLTLLATLPGSPVDAATRAGDDALYVVQKTGRISALRGGQVDPQPVLQLPADSLSSGLEQGLLGLAFSPDGAYMYVDYTDRQGETRLVEYAFVDGKADVASRRELLFVDQPFANHNGGNLEFGPDGYLYFGLGDGGGAGDPQNNAQNLGSLLGKMLRIDPRSAQPYAVPASNPFVGIPAARPEIWSYGLRNPWKFSFDRVTGDLWMGDVGQNLWEEVDFQLGSSGGGENYGWRLMEGNHPYNNGTPPDNHVPPVYEYPHGQGCSITGGYAYRGTRIPALFGSYVFGDWCAGRVWTLRSVAGVSIALETGLAVPGVSSFAEDNAGELYAISLNGPVFRLDPAL